MDNAAVKAIYDCMLDSHMSQSQMVEYLAMSDRVLPGTNIDSQREMISNKIDFIVNNIIDPADVQNLITGRPDNLSFISSIFYDLPCFDVLSDCFSKSSLPSELKANILEAKNADGYTAFSQVLDYKPEVINPFLDMLKASGLHGQSAAEIILAKDQYGVSGFGRFAANSDAATLQAVVDRFPDLGIKSDLALDMLLVEHTTPDHQTMSALATTPGCEVFIKALKDPKLGINYDHALRSMYKKLMQTNPPAPHLKWLYEQALAQRPVPNQPAPMH
jgi:hypothetical protein